MTYLEVLHQRLGGTGRLILRVHVGNFDTTVRTLKPITIMLICISDIKLYDILYWFWIIENRLTSTTPRNVIAKLFYHLFKYNKSVYNPPAAPRVAIVPWWYRVNSLWCLKNPWDDAPKTREMRSREINGMNENHICFHEGVSFCHTRVHFHWKDYELRAIDFTVTVVFQTVVVYTTYAHRCTPICWWLNVSMKYVNVSLMSYLSWSDISLT